MLIIKANITERCYLSAVSTTEGRFEECSGHSFVIHAVRGLSVFQLARPSARCWGAGRRGDPLPKQSYLPTL